MNLAKYFKLQEALTELGLPTDPDELLKAVREERAIHQELINNIRSRIVTAYSILDVITEITDRTEKK